MKEAQIKFHSIVISLSTLIYFSVYEEASKLIQIHPIYKIALSSLATLSLYRIIAGLLSKIFDRVRPLRKWILGASYMEGTWIGFYIGVSGQPRFIIERYEQDIYKTVVRGHAYKEDKSYHTIWTSKPASINLEAGEISYMYELKGISDKTNGNGIAFFNFVRDGQDSPPRELKGFSADLQNDGKRSRSNEKKLSDDHKIDDITALNKAIEFYAERKAYF